ncbi:MAG: hypothetical protein U0840_26075 [Gemmataceae bacterium]
MIPLHRDRFFTFRFAEDRRVGRFHLEGVEAGSGLLVVRLDPVTGQPGELLARAVVGEGSWVELGEPMIVRAGGGFLVSVEEPPVSEAAR